jgi:uncharacterized membrane protein YoaK (UPF0700 family)
LNALWRDLPCYRLFILSVITGGWIAKRSTRIYKLVRIEAALLILASLIAIVFSSTGTLVFKWAIYLVSFIIVFAMGLQNALGKLFAKETYGPTTGL